MLARTPVKATDEMEKEKSPPRTQTLASKNSPPRTQTLMSNVRRSVENLEAAASASLHPTPTTGKTDAKISPRQVLPKRMTRLAEAKANVIKAKTNINNSRNLRTDIKENALEAVDKLFQIIKEAEAEIKKLKSTGETSKPETSRTIPSETTEEVSPEANSQIIEQLKEQSRLLMENGKKIDDLSNKMEEQHQQVLSTKNTYASVTAAQGVREMPMRNTLHSVVVTSKDETETGDEVLSRVRKAIDAKEGWIKVEKVRKAKDRKVIIGMQTEEERGKIKDRLQKEGVDLTVEEVKNKDPLLILRNVLVINTNEDVLKALRNQNGPIFDGLNNEENRVEVRYRRRTRNPHIGHVIVSVSPTIWRRVMDIGTVHIDLQRVRVEDQTPLVQCTRCLGFGHGKRYCKEPEDLCGHCGGPHMRSECPDWLSGTPPACRNCTKAKMDHGTPHNAFSLDCPVRTKWDEIARSTVAYC